MRVIVDVFREADGRLEGRIETANGWADSFASTLDLLRALEGLDLTRPDQQAEVSGESAERASCQPEDTDD